jgi:elongation factor Ts
MNSIELIRELRKSTGASMQDVKQALKETGGDLTRATEWLKQKGFERGSKKTGRTATQGIVTSYIHSGGRVGVLLELSCETDFVARTEDFKILAHELALQIASMQPHDIPSLLAQEYIRSPDRKVEELIGEAKGKFGENITVRRFIRYEVGE